MTNNDYLILPTHLQDVYRSAGLPVQLFHYPSGKKLSLLEVDELLQAWQEVEVRSGAASWDNPPCENCHKSVCTCHANPEATFNLPPEH